MNNHIRGGGGFFSGFLLGIVIGAGAMFIFGTKRGKRLLKSLSDEGTEGMEALEDFLKDLEEEEASRPKPKHHIASNPTNGKKEPNGQSGQPLSVPALLKPRRFFRGVKKKR